MRNTAFYYSVLLFAALLTLSVTADDLSKDVVEISTVESTHFEDIKAPAEPLTPNDYRIAQAINNMTTPTDNVTDPIEMAGLFEGDIHMDPEEMIRLEEAEQKNAVIFDTARWPDGVIPYMISSDFTARERSIIARAFTEYHRRTCIRFQSRELEMDYIYIIKAQGCSSPVGKVGGPQPLSLGDGCIFPGVAMHELMHAVGFWHEQSRSDRDQHVTILYENILPKMEQNFKKYSWSQIQNLTAKYDTSSILHYGPTAYAKKWDKPTIVPKVRNDKMGQRNNLSSIDVFKINRLYECDTTETTSSTRPKPVPIFNSAGQMSCSDSHQLCNKWADKDECTKNPSWMLVNCRKSCDACDSSCSDMNLHCSTWAKSGECDINPDYMHFYCAKSCGLCQRTTSSVASSLSTSGATSAHPCEDRNKNCVYWANHGECSKNPDYMSNNCAKSCKKCNSATESTTKPTNSPCDDLDRNCAYWASQGECSKNPNYMNEQCSKSCKSCNATSVPTTPRPKCTDKEKHCGYWAAHGECIKNANYMQSNCPKSCHSC